MESESYVHVVALVILAAAVLGDCTDINNELRLINLKIQSMQENIEKLEFELTKELEGERTRSRELEIQLKSVLSRSTTAVADDESRVVLDCGLHMGIPNGNVTGDSFVGGTPIISCDAGYSQFGSAQCKVPVAWQSDAQCLRDCPPSDIPNASVHSSTSILHGQSVTVTCDEGFTIDGVSTVTCHNGVFDNPLPCKAVCPELEVPNAVITPPTGVSHGAVVTVTCNDGYMLDGNHTTVCNNGVYDSLPSCVGPLLTGLNLYYFKLENDLNTPYISGSAFLADGQLVLCDFNNNRIKLLDSSFTMIDSIWHSDPWDVSTINTTHVLVASRNSRELQYVHVLPELRLGSVLRLDVNCWSVDVVEEEIFIACHKNELAVEIRVYNIDGTFMRRINAHEEKDHRFFAPFYLNVSPRTGHMYLSYWRSDKFMCLSNDGNIVYQYTDEALKRPRGLHVDVADNLLVACLISFNVQIITDSGRKAATFYTPHKGPWFAAYRQNDKTVVFGELEKSSG